MTQKDWGLIICFLLYRDQPRSLSRHRVNSRRASLSFWDWLRLVTGAGKALFGKAVSTSKYQRVSSRRARKKALSPCSSTPRRNCVALTSSWLCPRSVKIVPMWCAPSCSLAFLCCRRVTNWYRPTPTTSSSLAASSRLREDEHLEPFVSYYCCFAFESSWDIASTASFLTHQLPLIISFTVALSLSIIEHPSSSTFVYIFV